MWYENGSYDESLLNGNNNNNIFLIRLKKTIDVLNITSIKCPSVGEGIMIFIGLLNSAIFSLLAYTFNFSKSHKKKCNEV